MKKLVVATTPTCMPCKQLAPVLEEIAKEYADKLTVEKVNLYENREMIDRFDIKGVPFIIMFDEDNSVLKLKQGCTGKLDLLEFVTPFVKE